jgi:hypothetical protein
MAAKTKSESKALATRKTKPPTKALATTRPTKPKWVPPPPPASYQYASTPSIDPQTRHALVMLAEQVKTFENVEDRVKDLARAVTKIENARSETPDGWWHQLRVSISTLQKDFRDRIPPLEQQYANFELLVSRIDRLEVKIERLEKKITKDESPR